MKFDADIMSSQEGLVLTATDVYSLTDFQRNARDHIERLKATGGAEILTVNGRAEVVVQSAEAYQELLDRVDRAEAVLGIRRGLDDLAEGKGSELEEVLERLGAEVDRERGDAD